MNNRTTTDNRSRPGVARELMRNASLAWRLLLDPQVSPLAKLVPVAVAAYVILPFDLIPDVFPVLGQLDDLAVVLIGMRIFIALCPPARVQLHRGDIETHDDPPAESGETIDGSYRIVDE
jgi:uncharacterized membrane protein YkvA (DUF1232 family)